MRNVRGFLLATLLLTSCDGLLAAVSQAAADQQADAAKRSGTAQGSSESPSDGQEVVRGCSTDADCHWGKSCAESKRYPEGDHYVLERSCAYWQRNDLRPAPPGTPRPPVPDPIDDDAPTQPRPKVQGWISNGHGATCGPQPNGQYQCVVNK